MIEAIQVKLVGLLPVGVMETGRTMILVIVMRMTLPMGHQILEGLEEMMIVIVETIVVVEVTTAINQQNLGGIDLDLNG